MIRASCHTADNALALEFDATPWSVEADRQSLLHLAKQGWSSTWVADALEMHSGYEVLRQLVSYATTRLRDESLEDLDPAVPRRNQMNTAPFEIIPAWRIARLRSALRDAERRAATPDDEGHDLNHRALQRRFALARGRAENVPRLASRPKTTRKGRSFPHLKLVIIWRAILSCRSSAWRQGDTAPFGSIRRAHDQAVAACRAAGLTPPRYRTVYVLWHRGVPPAELVAALRGEYPNPNSMA
jgi:hypothetical protein